MDGYREIASRHRATDDRGESYLHARAGNPDKTQQFIVLCACVIVYKNIWTLGNSRIETSTEFVGRETVSS